MMTLELIRKLRDIAKVGVVNARDDIRILNEAADRLEELEERIEIMAGDQYKSSEIRFP